ncbi:MAG TPA: efflux RND transporter periplasmic adaptor subunit [Rhizomicrobium sp.]|nr:efflux RND transporter periplasmic adaptor subunit [Rhizomicrobium sp.]
MNIRFPTTIESFPESVQKIPAAIRTNTRARLIASIVGVVLLVAIAWVVVRALQPAPKKANPPAPVIVEQVTRKSVRVVENTIGTILAENTVQLSAQVTGQMTAAPFHEGQIVHAGDLLFQIDPRPFQAALSQAQAQLAKDQASLVSAQNDATRYTTLFAQGASSQQLRDQAVATAKGFAASVQSDKAAIDVAKLNLGYTHIRSPITGKTGPILIQPGNIVTANSTTPLVTITQIQPVKVSFFLPQSELTQIQSQMAAGRLEAVIPMPGAAGNKETAPVNFVGNAVSAQTGTIELRATFTNDDLRLVPGQTVEVGTTTKDLPNVLVVPHDALNPGLDRTFVYVVSKDSKAVEVPVTVLNDDGTTAAVQGKIKPGDKVIVEGQLRVVDNGPVTVNKNGHHTPTPHTPVGAQ